MNRQCAPMANPHTDTDSPLGRILFLRFPCWFRKLWPSALLQPIALWALGSQSCIHRQDTAGLAYNPAFPPGRGRRGYAHPSLDTGRVPNNLESAVRRMPWQGPACGNPPVCQFQFQCRPGKRYRRKRRHPAYPDRALPHRSPAAHNRHNPRIGSRDRATIHLSAKGGIAAHQCSGAESRD